MSDSTRCFSACRARPVLLRLLDELVEAGRRAGAIGECPVEGERLLLRQRNEDLEAVHEELAPPLRVDEVRLDV